MSDGLVPKRIMGLYLRLSAWLIPSFLCCALIGLSILSARVVTDVERSVTMRVGNVSARVASGLERLADEFHAAPDLLPLAGQQLIQTLMSDPAIQCAELREGGGTPILSVPPGLGCHAAISGRVSTLPVWFGSDAELVVTWSGQEVATARQTQRDLSLAILIGGLVIALATNWLAFRVIIGRPLKALIDRVERARHDAEYNSLHDSLTGLPNRRHLDTELDRRLTEARRVGRPLAVLHVDLDGFKPINDVLGHAAGDHVLRHVAKTLQSFTGPGGFVARAGGDEFVIILAEEAGPEAAQDQAAEIIAELSRNVDYEGEYCRVGASIGIAIDDGGGDQDTSARLLANADIALFRAKEAGRGQLMVFNDDMRAKAEERRKLADELHEALAAGEFVAHYQPQTDCTGTRLLGLEALVRWQHPTRGLLFPGDFLPVAEEIALVDQIDRLVLVKAIADLDAWRAQGFVVPRVAVNVSAKRLNSPGLIPDLRTLDIQPDQFVFEVLESVFLDQASETVLWNLDGMREMGIELEIDDFGTGRASISSVLALRPTRLKVAREIVTAYADEGAQRALLEAIVALGRSLGVGLLAEGVETQAQLREVANLGFDRVQGYAIARPMPPEAIALRLARHGEARWTTAAAPEQARHGVA